MYRWYERSYICCVYLSDVTFTYSFETIYKTKLDQFNESRWFTRGWTLQELLAPRQKVEFWDRHWSYIGDVNRLEDQIVSITGIPSGALRDFKPLRWSIAQRMSWAANRKTTRIEDQAYSLLGIFNVNMPLLYGEGVRAFQRLQEELICSFTDQTIFCWSSGNLMAPFSSWTGFLAKSPSRFSSCADCVEHFDRRLPIHPIQTTSRGV
jgi:hypothetical protein